MRSGGIAGHASLTSIKNCYNVGIISGDGNIGGIVGYADYDDEYDEYAETVFIYNSYCLTDLFGGFNGGSQTQEDTIDAYSGKVEESVMKSENMIELLNNENEAEYKYVQDTNQINNGYPILSWQQ